MSSAEKIYTNIKNIVSDADEIYKYLKKKLSKLEDSNLIKDGMKLKDLIVKDEKEMMLLIAHRSQSAHDSILQSQKTYNKLSSHKSKLLKNLL